MISDQWKYDITQDWEYLAKNLDGISIELTEDEALLRLNMPILATGYLEKGVFCFTKVTEDNKKTNKNNKKAETISNSEEEIKKRVLHKEKKDAQALLLAAAYLYLSSVLMPGLSTPLFVSAFAVSLPVLGSTPPSASKSGVSVLVPRLLVLLFLLSMFGVSMPVLESIALLSVLSVFDMSMPVSGLLALLSVLSVSGVSVLEPGLSALLGLFSLLFPT